jgi:hypothetical protein
MNTTPRQVQLGRPRRRGQRQSIFHTADLTSALCQAIPVHSHAVIAAIDADGRPNAALTASLELKHELQELRSAFGPSASLQVLAASLAAGPVVFPQPTLSSTEASAIDPEAVFGAGGGLSRAAWYYTADHKYVFKSVRQGELNTLAVLLPDLSRHVAAAQAQLGFGGASGAASPPTLLPAYLAVVRVRAGARAISCRGQKPDFFGIRKYASGNSIVLVAMANIYWRDAQGFGGIRGPLLEAYDIKGSGYNALKTHAQCLDLTRVQLCLNRYRFRAPAEECEGPLKDLNWCSRYMRLSRLRCNHVLDFYGLSPSFAAPKVSQRGIKTTAQGQQLTSRAECWSATKN